MLEPIPRSTNGIIAKLNIIKPKIDNKIKKIETLYHFLII